MMQELGMNQGEIAKIEKVNPSFIRDMREDGTLEEARQTIFQQNTPLFRPYYRAGKLLTAFEKRLEVAGEAMDTLARLMLESDDERVRFAAAKELAKPILNAPAERIQASLQLDDEASERIRVVVEQLRQIRRPSIEAVSTVADDNISTGDEI